MLEWSDTCLFYTSYTSPKYYPLIWQINIFMLCACLILGLLLYTYYVLGSVKSKLTVIDWCGRLYFDVQVTPVYSLPYLLNILHLLLSIRLNPYLDIGYDNWKSFALTCFFYSRKYRSRSQVPICILQNDCCVMNNLSEIFHFQI